MNGNEMRTKYHAGRLEMLDTCATEFILKNSLLPIILFCGNDFGIDGPGRDCTPDGSFQCRDGLGTLGEAAVVFDAVSQESLVVFNQLLKSDSAFEFLVDRNRAINETEFVVGQLDLLDNAQLCRRHPRECGLGFLARDLTTHFALAKWRKPKNRTICCNPSAKIVIAGTDAELRGRVTAHQSATPASAITSGDSHQSSLCSEVVKPDEQQLQEIAAAKEQRLSE